MKKPDEREPKTIAVVSVVSASVVSASKLLNSFTFIINPTEMENPNAKIKISREKKLFY